MGTLAIAGSVIGAGGIVDSYSPNAWLLNGTSQYLWRDGVLPRHQNDEAFLFTAGFTRAAGSAGTESVFWAQNDFHFTITIGSDNKIFVGGAPIVGSTSVSVKSVATIADDDAVHALAIHCDLSTASPVLTMVLDGTAISTAETILVGEENIDFQASQHFCGAKFGATPNHWDGCLWNVGLDHDDSANVRDLTTQANIDAIMSGNQMKDPGSDGSNYFGRQPVAMFQNPSATAEVNTGGGSDFAVQGGTFRCLRVGPDIGNPPTYVSMHLFGSNYSQYVTATTTPPEYSLDEFATAIEAEGPDRIGYYSDDINQWNTNTINRVNDWISRGFHFGMEPIGSDSLYAGGAETDSPIEVQYDGAGTNPTLTISNGGKTWALTAEGVTDDADNVTWNDVSAGTIYEQLKWDLLIGHGTGISDHASWTADIQNPPYSGSFDDSFSESLEAGVYELTGIPPITIEPRFDQLRRKELEIDYGLTTALANGLSSVSQVLFNPLWQTENPTVETFLRTQSTHTWIGNFAYYVGTDPTTGISQRISDATPISDIDPWEINMGIGLGATPQPSTTYFKGVPAEYDALSAAEKEHRVRLAAKGLSCEGAGAYVPITFTFSGLDSELWSPEEVVWLIDEFKKQKVEIMLIDEFVELIT